MGATWRNSGPVSSIPDVTTRYPTTMRGQLRRHLPQWRMPFGFGVLNPVNVLYAFPSALQIMLWVSPKLTLACLANLPLVTLFTRWVSRGLFLRMRENQASLGRMSDVLQANLAGV